MDTARVIRVLKHMNWLGKSMLAVAILVPIVFCLSLYFHYSGNENMEIRLLALCLFFALFSAIVFRYEVKSLDKGEKGLFWKD
mgnify:CR=1 FL=1